MASIDDWAGKEYDETDYADPSETDLNDCQKAYYRDIYKGGFPNCVATVEDGSWCGSNDACLSLQVRYTGMHDCTKAWR
jgi:hypothetical protein